MGRLISKVIGDLINLRFYLLRRPKTGVLPQALRIGAVEILPFLKGYKGGMVISADFEMAWAWRYSKRGEDPAEMGKRERKNIPKLIDLFEEYNVPITWATVGHLFLESCRRGVNGLPHPDMPRPPHFENKWWKFDSGDWYQHDPCSNYKLAPEWYAPDLVSMILQSEVKHEIGLHSFSHISFSKEICSENLARKEIEKNIEAMKPFEIVPKSMVFPGGFKDYIEILREYGIIAYRGNHKTRGVELAYPFKHHGVWNIPASTSISERKYLLPKQQLIRLKRYIDRAIKDHVVFHLWFHPSLNKYLIDEVLEPLLQYATIKRQKRELWITTMSELAMYCEVREKMSFNVIEKGNKLTILCNSSQVPEYVETAEISLLLFNRLKKPHMIKFDGKEVPPDVILLEETIEKNGLILTFPVNVHRVDLVF